MNQYSGLTDVDREQLFWRNVNVGSPDVCWEWQASRFPNGYGQTKLGISRKGNTTHRVALEYSMGAEIPSHFYVLHNCDNKPCCNPAHLRIGSHRDNMVDRDRSGLTCRGDRHRWWGVPKTAAEKEVIRAAQLGRRKHDSRLIEAIRAELGSMSLRSLAKKHGVKYAYVQRIGAGKI